MMAAICFISLDTVSEIYKWTDQDGNTHYGDRPNAESEKLKLKDTKADQAERWEAVQQRKQRFLEYLQDERKDRQALKTKDDEVKAERKKRCQEASDYLQDLNTTRLWYREDEQGNKTYLDHKEKDAEIDKAKKMVDKYCSN